MGGEQARALVEARLGRPAQDVLEAAIVLEAWGGLRAPSTFALGAAVIEVTPRQPPPERATDAAVLVEHPPSQGHGLGLVCSLLAIALWTIPLSTAFGASIMEQARQVALPMTIGMQGLVLRRSFSGPGGLSRLRRDLPGATLLLVGAVGVVALLTPHGRVLAGTLVFVWVAALVWVERGWGAAYAAALAAGMGALWIGVPPVASLVLTASLVGAGLVAALVSVPATSRPPTSWQRAGPAGLVGAGVGFLLLRAAGPHWDGAAWLGVLALFPAFTGSMWAGRHQARLWRVVPEALVTRSVRRPEGAGLARLAIAVFLGGLARAVLATGVLSLLILGLATMVGAATPGLAPLLLALGGIGVVGCVVWLLEGLGRSVWAMAVVAAACVASELALRYGLTSQLGAAFVVPGIAVLMATYPLAHLLGGIGFSLTRSSI